MQPILVNDFFIQHNLAIYLPLNHFSHILSQEFTDSFVPNLDGATTKHSVELHIISCRQGRVNSDGRTRHLLALPLPVVITTPCHPQAWRRLVTLHPLLLPHQSTANKPLPHIQDFNIHLSVSIVVTVWACNGYKPPLTRPYSGPHHILGAHDKHNVLDINGHHNSVSINSLKVTYSLTQLIA